MTNYAKTALEAVNLYQSNATADPRAAWEMAVEMYVQSLAGRAKSCPRSAFLGLCEEGWIIGVPNGNYTRSERNKEYAIRAVRLLRANPHLADNALELWGEVMRGGDNENKRHDGQMNVVIALWNAALIAPRD